MLYQIPQLATSCISIVFFSFEYFDSFYHYAACWVTLSALDYLLYTKQ